MTKRSLKSHRSYVMRVIVTVLAVTMLAFTPTPEPLVMEGIDNSIAVEAATTVYYTYVVTTPAGLNVRSGPGTNYKKVGKLSGGTVFTAYNSKSGWLQIANGKWVCRDYCAQCSSFIDWNYEVRHGVIVKTSGSNRFNLRSGPSESFSIVAKIPNGTRLSPSYKYNGWCYVTYKGYTGWISMKYTKNDY